MSEMEKQYYVEFNHGGRISGIESDYDYVFAEWEDVETIIASKYGDVEITLIEEYIED